MTATCSDLFLCTILPKDIKAKGTIAVCFRSFHFLSVSRTCYHAQYIIQV